MTHRVTCGFCGRRRVKLVAKHGQAVMEDHQQPLLPYQCPGSGQVAR